jgi:predicted Zn-dependent protease
LVRATSICCLGATPPAEIIASVKDGFYVTEMIGFGFNPVTGDYSRGRIRMVD